MHRLILGENIHLKEMENNEDGLEAPAHLLGTSPSPSLTTCHTYCLTIFAFSFVFSISQHSLFPTAGPLHPTWNSHLLEASRALGIHSSQLSIYSHTCLDSLSGICVCQPCLCGEVEDSFMIDYLI